MTRRISTRVEKLETAAAWVSRPRPSYSIVIVHPDQKERWDTLVPVPGGGWRSTRGDVEGRAERAQGSS